MSGERRLFSFSLVFLVGIAYFCNGNCVWYRQRAVHQPIIIMKNVRYKFHVQTKSPRCGWTVNAFVLMAAGQHAAQRYHQMTTQTLLLFPKMLSISSANQRNLGAFGFVFFAEEENKQLNLNAGEVLMQFLLNSTTL